MINIDQKTFAEIVKLGGQYFLPLAALLRALYEGMRGRFPQGLSQIALASFLAGLTAVVSHDTLDLRSIILDILGNTVFTAGLLAFIMAYLLKLPNRGLLFDGAIGAGIGLVAFGVWTIILQKPWPWWTFPLAVIAGGGGFVVLRGLLRQIAKLIKITTYFIVAAVVLMIGGFGLLGINFVMQFVNATPTPLP